MPVSTVRQVEQAVRPVPGSIRHIGQPLAKEAARKSGKTLTTGKTRAIGSLSRQWDLQDAVLARPDGPRRPSRTRFWNKVSRHSPACAKFLSQCFPDLRMSPAPIERTDELIPRERSQPGRRNKPDTSELRAAVSPLRELANQSARAALAKHSSRKFRRSLALTLPVVTAHLSWAPSSSAWEAKEGISRRMLMAQ